jgi:polyketide cyclase/dehydrase/lipid transport protein
VRSNAAMTPTFTVHVSRAIAAPAARVWTRVSDHANTHTWVREARVELLEPGEPAPDGKGALRRVAFPDRPLWTTILERVTAFDPGTSFSYKVVRGMPGLRDHLGTVSVTPRGDDRCELTWHVDFEFPAWHPMRLFGKGFVASFGAVLQAALDELATQLSA